MVSEEKKDSSTIWLMLKEIVNLDKTVEEGMIVLIVMIELEKLTITNIGVNIEEDLIQEIADILSLILQE